MRVVGLLVVAALAASPVLASFLLYVPTVEISGVQNCAELSGLQIDGHDVAIEDKKKLLCRREGCHRLDPAFPTES
ncbi:hypothetical protein QR680_013079 [Steinernema hermaphroditum]|uniref:Uncharacterized protein n=1 Tax=Steinernema hermaphroditum TaxID=289476 RepID=A0AA39M1Y6_9BILA|nr:hypothetical protein QR680_013079 [Steinernema hermaphroditum]